MKVSPILNYLFCCSLLLLIQCTSEKNINNSSQNQQTKMIYSGSTGNVKLYGAKGDGVTNDTEAFQKAIDAITLVSNNGQTKVFSSIVYIPCGVYLIDGLTIGRGVTIQGEGTNCVELVANIPNKRFIKTGRGTKQNQYIKIRNITLRGKGSGTGIDLEYANFDSHIKECVISDFGTNIRLESCWDFLIDDCHIDDAKGNNIEAFNITASVISNCRIDDAGRHNVYITKSKATGVTVNIYLLNNNIQRAQFTGVTFDGVLLPKISNCLLEGNNIAGGVAFVNVIGTTDAIPMFSMNECFFTSGKRSAKNSIGIKFSNKTKMASINTSYFSSSLAKDIVANANLKSLTLTACQNNVKNPLKNLSDQTEVVNIGSHFRVKKKMNKLKMLTQEKPLVKGKGSPIGKKKPKRLGEEYLDTINGVWYKSVSLDITGWKKLNY